jgi:hypothetical protein
MWTLEKDYTHWLDKPSPTQSETRVLYNALLDHEWYRESVVEGRRVLGMLLYQLMTLSENRFVEAQERMSALL